MATRAPLSGAARELRNRFPRWSRTAEWETALNGLEPALQTVIRSAVVNNASPGWRPRPSDMEMLAALASNTVTVDACLASLTQSWTQQQQGTEAADACAESHATWAASSAASAGAATRARWLFDRAREANLILLRIRRVPADGASSEWVKRVAGETLRKRGPDGTSGALGQFRGHLFEQLDLQTYNLRNARFGRKLVLRTNAHAPGYDASRFVYGRFAGGVQHKFSPSGVIKAADKLNARKAGSATRATLRLPKDQVARAKVRVAGRIRVEPSDISTRMLKRRGDAGLRRLASQGTSAVSPLRQAGRSAGFAAMTGAALGAVSDARKLYRGQMSAHEFATLRGMDAGEQVASQLAGVLATGGVFAGLNGLAAGTGVVAGAAATAAGSTVVVPLAVSTGVGAAVVYSLQPIRRRAQTWAAQRTKRQAPQDSKSSERGEPGEAAHHDEKQPISMNLTRRRSRVRPVATLTRTSRPRSSPPPLTVRQRQETCMQPEPDGPTHADKPSASRDR